MGVVQIDGREFFIGLAADGAGSTVCGGEGARIACETTYQEILDTIRHTQENAPVPETAIRAWITSSRDAIADHAKSQDKPLKEYACTMLGFVSGDRYSTYFQIGDGGIVVSNEENYDTVFWRNKASMQTRPFLFLMMRFSTI